MNPRQVVPALLVAFATAFLVIVVGGGGGDDGPDPDAGAEVRIGDPLAEALLYLPSEPDGVMIVQTGGGDEASIADGGALTSVIDGALGSVGTTVSALRPLLGNPAIAAIPADLDLPAPVEEEDAEGEEDENGMDPAALDSEVHGRTAFAADTGGVRSDPELEPLPPPDAPLEELGDPDPLPPPEDDFDEPLDDPATDPLDPLDDPGSSDSELDSELDSEPDSSLDDSDLDAPEEDPPSLGIDVPTIAGDVDAADVVAPLARRTRLAWVTADAEALADYVDTRAGSAGLSRGEDVSGHRIYTRPEGTSLAIRGPVLVVAPTPQDLRDAIALRTAAGADGQGGDSLTAADLRERVEGLPGPGESIVRVAVERDGLLESFPVLRSVADATSWTTAVSRVALALVPGESSLRVPYRITTGAADLALSDVPLAGGITAPNPSGEAPVLISVRDLGHTVKAARRAIEAGDQDVAAQLDRVEGALRRYAGIDLGEDVLDKLAGTATLTIDSSGLTLRSDLVDAGEVNGALGRISRILDVGDFVGGFGVDIDTGGFGLEGEGDGRYRLTKDGEDLVTLGVAGNSLVVSTDTLVDLESLADPAPAPADGARGALYARIAEAALSDIVDRAAQDGAEGLEEDLAGLGAITLTGAGSAEYVEGELRVAIDGE